ncbi:hypothetical protein B0H10DRAFT_1954718 [Mycena sp. CBHHK59/15]|nr:hypothetical protein B0H10DRAFT_1954718 [Mycena sp. CBHHK59/15]
MPARQTGQYDADFEDAKGIACSTTSDTKDVVILKSGQKIHLKSPKHEHSTALLAATSARGVRDWQADQSTRNLTPGQWANLKLADLFAELDYPDEPSGSYHARSPLDDIIMDGNQFFDLAHNEIFFTAGMEDVQVDTRRQELLQEYKRSRLPYNNSMGGCLFQPKYGNW